ncbi:type I-E CRISPR-associated protein Cse1/CasA [Sinosporangium siamense]|uniref:Type I-E CRISPR-associated protein Cse1/CasA n=1 Tax=Sinosporangium siamense TaxID=1367973 RepID=A0A919RJB5_9ACTN|nr:type I-E CRISPR-associated protein Cse1/CasA [Sinosporangium siamense]GII94317.1 type I-E CRISPR-associated protein Cse1/CasA [Sinosporangium siamense]
MTHRGRHDLPQEEASFDLLSRPWIPAVDLEGTETLLGLEDVLAQAHEIRRIVTEAPTMTAALHRLLIALLHRALDGPAGEDEWARLWAAERLPVEELRDYFHEHRHRFDLFHPALPFMQCAALATLVPATAAKLVPYRAVGNNVTLFDHTTAADRVRLSPAEAARWLVTLQAFDPGGMKTPYEKDKSSERAPCNMFGVVLVEGGTLKETLLLNLLVYRPDYEKPRMTTPGDRPVWEELGSPSPRPERRISRGWTDLLTWPSRRVLLSPAEYGGATVVDGVVVTPGTRCDVHLPDEEKMAAFRRPRDAKGQFQRNKSLLPVVMHPLRGIWRHSAELLLTDVRDEDRNRQRPSTLDQIAGLAERGHLPSHAVYTLRVFGQRLDSKASVVETWMEASIPAPVPLLRARDEALGALIGCAITLADDAGAALRSLVREYRAEFRNTTIPDIDPDYWPRLASPFGDFLVELARARTAGMSEGPVMRRWAYVVTRLATSAANRWASGAPVEGRAMLALGKQYGQFHKRLHLCEERFHAQVVIYSAEPEAARV